jgi:hypothetical protein
MASPDITQILKAPGRLAINPQNLATAWPHGGTGLGLIQDIFLKPSRAYETIREEAFGNEVVDVVDLGESVIIAASLRGFDGDAIGTLFPSTVLATLSGKREVLYPNPSGGTTSAYGTFRAGTFRSGNSVVLMYTPDDYNKYPSLICYRAIPLVEATAEIKFSYEEGMIPVMFQAIRDTSNRLYAWGRLEDLSL